MKTTILIAIVLFLSLCAVNAGPDETRTIVVDPARLVIVPKAVAATPQPTLLNRIISEIDGWGANGGGTGCHCHGYYVGGFCSGIWGCPPR